MAKVQLESEFLLIIKMHIFICSSELRQAERQGPLSKRFGM